jgi:hypothetical protein
MVVDELAPLRGGNKRRKGRKEEDNVVAEIQ